MIISIPFGQPNFTQDLIAYIPEAALWPLYQEVRERGLCGTCGSSSPCFLQRYGIVKNMYVGCANILTNIQRQYKQSDKASTPWLLLMNHIIAKVNGVHIHNSSIILANCPDQTQAYRIKIHLFHPHKIK